MTPQEMVVRLIEEAGMSGTDIAKACKTSQPTIHRIMDGAVKDPRWSHGWAIRKLYLQHFPSDSVAGDAA